MLIRRGTGRKTFYSLTAAHRLGKENNESHSAQNRP